MINDDCSGKTLDKAYYYFPFLLVWHFSLHSQSIRMGLPYEIQWIILQVEVDGGVLL